MGKRPRGGLGQRNVLGPKIGEGLDRAVVADHQLKAFRKQARDRAQVLQRSVGGEDAGSRIGPADNVGLGYAGFDLPGGNHTEVLDRALCRLRHRNQTWNSAIAAVLTRRRAARLRDSAGDDRTDLEKGPRGRRCADTKELAFLCARRYTPQEETENANSGRDRTGPPNAELSGHRLTGETAISENNMDHTGLQQRSTRSGAGYARGSDLVRRPWCPRVCRSCSRRPRR